MVRVMSVVDFVMSPSSDWWGHVRWHISKRADNWRCSEPLVTALRSAVCCIQRSPRKAYCANNGNSLISVSWKVTVVHFSAVIYYSDNGCGWGISWLIPSPDWFISALKIRPLFFFNHQKLLINQLINYIIDPTEVSIPFGASLYGCLLPRKGWNEIEFMFKLNNDNFWMRHTYICLCNKTQQIKFC